MQHWKVGIMWILCTVPGNETCTETDVVMTNDCNFPVIYYFRNTGTHTYLLIISNDISTVIKPIPINIYNGKLIATRNTGLYGQCNWCTVHDTVTQLGSNKKFLIGSLSHNRQDSMFWYILFCNFACMPTTVWKSLRFLLLNAFDNQICKFLFFISVERKPQLSIIIIPVSCSLVVIIIIVFGISYFIQSRNR